MFRTLAVGFFAVGLIALKAQDPSYGNLANGDYYDGDYDDQSYDADADAALVETTEPPPPLLEYDQPEIPGDDYYWTPGYWAWGPGGYYWVPGAWVLAPYVGAVWTPPYWAFGGGYYRWHPGYWGTHVGFYGGINYGFGYTGRGYYGAYWNRGHLSYNRSVTRVNVNIVRNVYNYSAPRGNVSRVSFNGGRGGVNVRATAQERAVVRERRMPAIAAQTQHAREASNNRAQFATSGQRQQRAVETHPLGTQRGQNRQVPQASENRLELGPRQAAPQPQRQAPPQPQQPRMRVPQERQNHPEVGPRQGQPAPERQFHPEVGPAPAPQAQPAPQAPRGRGGDHGRGHR